MWRIRSLFFGLTLPLNAARLILQKRGLLLWSIIPIVITLVLYFWLIRWLGSEIQTYAAQLFQHWGWSSESWGFWILNLFTQLLLLVVSALTFAFSATLMASPFNDHLAFKSETYASPSLPAVASQNFGNTLRLMMIDIGKTLAAALAGFSALMLSWIPIVNIFAFALAMVLVTFQFTSYPQTRRGIGLGDGLRFLLRHLWACVGFGLAVSFFFSIPVFSSFFLPAAVVGGTLLVARAPGGEGLRALK